MNIEEINNTIIELEYGETNFANCQKLASLYIIRDHYDLVPESNADEFIENLLQLFVSYYNSQSIDTLKPLLDTIYQVVSELYNISPSDEHQQLFRNFIYSMTKIAT